MRKSRIVLFAPLFAIALAGCPGDPPDGSDGGSDGSTVTECALGEADCCARNRDCSHLSDATYTAYCDKSGGATRGTCEYLCNMDSDCDGADFEPTLCAGGACVCDDGICTIPACSNDADCGGTGRCIGGTCAGGETAPDGCVIAPDPLYVREGQTGQLFAYATKAGAFTVADGTWSWGTSDAGIADVNASTGLVTGGTASGTATITATLTAAGGTATCTADATNYASAGAGDVQVVVLDELTRDPIVGATVVVQDAEGGAVLGEGATAADGSVTVAGIAAASIHAHVFTAADNNLAAAPNGYAYVSALGISSKDLVVYLPRNASSAKAGGYTGTMTKEEFDLISSDDVHVMLAGVSLPGNFIDLDLSILVGEMIPTHVKFGNLLDDEIPLPSGLVLGVGSEFFKDDYSPLGLPGERTAWALGGNLPLADVTQVLSPVVSGGTSDLPIGELLAALLPLFNGFNSAVKPGVTITEYDRVATTDAGGNTIYVPDFASFPNETLVLDTPLALKGIVDMPTLPQVGGVYVDGAVVLGGVLVEGQGLVPLGITAGVDTTEDTQTPNGIVNDEGDEPTPGEAVIRMAPQHGGIEGSKYVLLALALGFDSLSGSGGGQALSGFAKLFDGLSFEEEISFGAASFMGFAEAATWNGTTRTYTPGAVTGADMYRLAVDGTGDMTWIVYHDGTAATDLIDPAAYTCGGAACNDPLAGTPNLDAQAVSAGGLDVSTLFEFNGQNLDDVVRLVQGFSTIDISQ